MADDNHQMPVKRQYMPAKGLLNLTWVQVEKIDRLVAEVCKAGHGAIQIVVERGLPFCIEVRRSEKLRPARDEGC